MRTLIVILCLAEMKRTWFNMVLSRVAFQGTEFLFGLQQVPDLSVYQPCACLVSGLIRAFTFDPSIFTPCRFLVAALVYGLKKETYSSVFLVYSRCI